MHITRLRLIGFKSFVEPTELLIENGLTAVVGPNGCGKSNLLEALRWVMGETSYKSMRAAAMDDVIFSGTSSRPARNMAEVTIFVDNSDRRAPAEFNDHEQIEISRRIEREAGSTYRINGHEVRARDVKILFEDAATGARSPALVRQGQIGEIVNAKPEQRRRILEDAAGTAGLHSRRHEAELRLKAAAGNLARLGDVVGQLKSQIDGLKRQARQARRYRELSDEIRKAEALQHYLNWSYQQAQVDHDEAALQVALEGLGAASAREAQAIKREAELADNLQPLRDEEVTRAAVLARLQHAQTNLENELRRSTQRRQEFEARCQQLTKDGERERLLVSEGQQQLASLKDDVARITLQGSNEQQAEAELAGKLAAGQAALQRCEQDLAELMTRQRDALAARSGLEVRLEELETHHRRLTTHNHHLDQQVAQTIAAAPDAEKLFTVQSQTADVTKALTTVDEELTAAEGRVVDCRDQLRLAVARRRQAELDLRQLETERQTLAKLVMTTAGDAPAIVDQITVQPGYEIALGAALGDDLDHPIGVAGQVHWRPATDDPPMPSDGPSWAGGVQPLADVVEAPPELAARLRHIGIVQDHDGPALQRRLMVGQRLVSRAGGLWRWDGLIAPAGAPTAAAQRLASRNRLRDLQSAEAEARAAFEVAAKSAEDADKAVGEAQRHEQDLRGKRRALEGRLGELSRILADMEAAARETEARVAALREAQSDGAAQLGAAETAIAAERARFAELPAHDHLRDDVDQLQRQTAGERERLAELKVRADAVIGERKRRAEQLAKLAADIKRWSARIDGSIGQLTELEARLTEAQGQLAAARAFPDQVESQRQRLLAEVLEAETARRRAGDALAAAETALKEANATLRAAQGGVSEQREIRARAETRLDAARARRAELVRGIEEVFATTPEGVLGIAGYDDDNALPTPADADQRLQRLRADRERLGGVNLQAGAELETLTAQYDDLAAERADVEAAIAKLRAGIASLNREGRKRLKEAFVTVDGHFQSLFTTLFGGGEAKLEMIDDSEDPLAGGLEIVARPPGKKPTTLSLLSGGEQTLTALSLIFAVFLTNPSPICVLDEVDAPLDDANVDRFCNLMDRMASDTDTRFLVITHHPMTMARVDRLFGVTMVERGVSQLVSVDLTAAEELLESA